jgi:hypothetical protein
MWIDSQNLELDECDGEPLCAKCKGDLTSSTDGNGVIALRCTTAECSNYRKTLVRANSYSEIARHLAFKTLRHFK